MRMRKLPKKPKASASVQTKQNWLKKAAEIKRDNARRKAQDKKSKALSAKIANYKL